MFYIDNVNDDWQIFFHSDANVSGVRVNLMDKNHEQPVYSTFFESFPKDVVFFISISSYIVSYLKNTYLRFETDTNAQSIDFSFPNNLLKDYSLYGNSCVVWRTYEAFNTQYTSPMIGHLILDDEMYVRFCEHADSYLKAEMSFGEVRNNIKWKNQTGNERIAAPSLHVPVDYPVSHHLDLDIHWIHANQSHLRFSDQNIGSYSFDVGKRRDFPDFGEKWRKRIERGKNTEKVFLWSSSEMHNVHGMWERELLLSRFKNLPHKSIFLTERKDEEWEDKDHVVHYVSEWNGLHQDDRFKGNGLGVGGGLDWNDQGRNAQIFKRIIKERWLKT
jgi:uncharacterized protein (DUF1919 family)